ncbi:PilC/PilY family type IV pilus protein [Aestuariibacter sp. AA17]|uniref:PilC/PilY family type IV pilus protein n=1 Tax=Fluctibacter corallii TaxID=2984329 RepID=A0ABT3A352_9ALTE|nr:PilC/PilY family type IV pilus protein [Aestuariibacter sp. AA17]MCV2883120.1 PilC/PilY family type IV pilus protein [Aestuariibacter sp. AA17]
MKFLQYSFSILLSTLLLCNVGFADDLEIYLGTGNETATYDPNVLFIMDTSGSMAGKDGGTESRMLRVQKALKETLQSATNINAGLMRFSDLGGPVLYPIRPIDDAVQPELVIPVGASNNDASERSGVVTLNDDGLVLTAGTDNVTTGLRFEGVNIPKGAVITNAYIRFTSHILNSASSNIKISGELSANAQAFQATSNDISDRTKTTAFVDWTSNNDFPLSEETISTPSLISVIQEIVDQNDWCGGNALGLILEGSSTSSASDRKAFSHDEGSGWAPQLVVSYDESTATGCVTGELSYQVNTQKDNAEERWDGYDSTGSELTLNDNNNRYIGIRFKNIAVPKGVTIVSAHLSLTAYQHYTGGSASMVIRGVNEDDPNDFHPYSRYLLRNKPKTAGVNWSGIPSWYKNNTYQSPDVSSIVQSLVNRSGWTSGNDMAFVLSDFSGFRGGYTYKGKPSGAAQLTIKYQGDASPGTTSTVREHLISKVDELAASGYTPIVDTLYEAVNYYGGRNVDYGTKRGDSSVSSTVRRNTRVSNRLSYVGADSVLPPGCSEDNLSGSYCIGEYIPSGAKYISPVTDLQCQTNNHIVLLSDGEANNNHSVSKIEALLNTSCSGSGGEKCGLDLVKNVSDTGDTVIDARVVTHTIGFAANSTANNFLNQLALQGGGGFYQADNSTDLVTAFQQILKTVKDVNATFVSPGVAVNQLNRLTHKNELYFALFKPAEGTIWPGNLKKYKINGDVILDKNGNPAVDSGSGFFSENSHSYWSVLADGNDVREGGAASLLDVSRRIYMFSDPGSIVTSANNLHESNSAISTIDLAIDSVADKETVRTQLLKWARGIDVKDDDGDGYTDDARTQMGDPIHSQPVIINYSANDSAILVATNQGFLHSFDAETGEENFAIIPKELLRNLYDFYQDGSTFSHIYGLDGDLVYRDTGTQKILYVGMRRGGRNYYAFDITSKTNPSLLFKIEGGSPGFEKLGQSWSRPTLTKVNIGGSSKTVLIFGGGYDEDQDNYLTRTQDSEGNAVFMVDADSGQLLWSASSANADLVLTDMNYSVPARISVIDREGDGYADHMYVADMGAQLFRLDIYNGNGTSTLVKGGLLADFSGAGEENNRRFFYGPDVSEISLANEHYYAVALGSGYRAHPLNAVIQDHFFMIKDNGVFNINTNGEYSLPTSSLGFADVYDATNHLLTDSDSSTRELEAEAFATKSGWHIRLGSGGEKVLASPLIINYKLFFTTYVPSTASQSACAPPAGKSRAYLVELINGNAVTDLDGDNQTEHQDRFADLQQTGIAPETKILIEDIIKPVVCLGTECTSAVIEVDEDGNPENCGTNFECLAQNIYGVFERVRKESWTTEVERQ